MKLLASRLEFSLSITLTLFLCVSFDPCFGPTCSPERMRGPNTKPARIFCQQYFFLLLRLVFVFLLLLERIFEPPSCKFNNSGSYLKIGSRTVQSNGAPRVG